MIATVLALVIGGVITIATFVCIAYVLAYLQDIDQN